MNIDITLYGIYNSFDKNSEMNDYAFYASVNLVNIWPNEMTVGLVYLLSHLSLSKSDLLQLQESSSKHSCEEKEEYKMHLNF